MQILAEMRRMRAGDRQHPRRRWPTAVAALAALGLSVSFAFAQEPAREDLVTKLAGKKVQIDKTTKTLRAITADEAREFIATVAKATESATIAAQVSTPLGTMVRLDDHVGHIIVSRPNEDGSVSLRCVGSADEAVAFMIEEGLPLQ